MRTRISIRYVVGFSAAIALLGGCSANSLQMSPNAQTARLARSPQRSAIRSYSVLEAATPRDRRAGAKSWIEPLAALRRLTYVSDANTDSVSVFGRNGEVVGQLGTGLINPQGVLVDSHRNLWVANTGASNVQIYARGTTSPSRTLDDPAGFPVDVAVCPNGTAYVSNIFNFSSGTGNIQIFPAGSNNPSGMLVYPGELENFFVTCDHANNVFTTLLNGSGLGVVVEFAGGSGSGTQLPITMAFPGGIIFCGGNLYVDDQGSASITEYTTAGSPTGNAIHTTSGDVASIALTRDCRVVGGADGAELAGRSWTFPGGMPRQRYSGSFSEPIGFAFDPAPVP